MSLLFSLKYTKGSVFSVSPVVGKSIFKLATKRNTLKRQIRSIAMMWYDKVPVGRYIVYVKKDAQKASFLDLKTNLEYDLKHFSRHSI